MKLKKEKNDNITYGVFKTIIKSNNRYYKDLYKIAQFTKNLYNKGNFYIKQARTIPYRLKNNLELFENQINVFSDLNQMKEEYNVKSSTIITNEFDNTKTNYINGKVLDKLLKNTSEYKALYSTIAQQTVQKLLDANWKSHDESLKDWFKNPSKYNGRPKQPKYYKDIAPIIIPYNIKGCRAVDGKIIFPQKNFLSYFSEENQDFTIHTDLTKFQEIRILPKYGHFVVEIVYAKEKENKNLNKDNVIGIDLGIKSLATITNNINQDPFYINGRPLMAINQHYNKEKARLQSCLEQGQHTSKRIESLTLRRNNKIEDYIHKASKYIIDYCIANNIGTIVIGKNDGWKQEVNLGKVNNQKFVQIPHSKFIDKIKYKADNVGITVVVNEESYSSKASFLDKDDIPVYGKKDTDEKYKFSGKRDSNHKFYHSSNGTLIHADVNGSYNIIQKHMPNAFNNCTYIGLHPKCINIEYIKPTKKK